MNFDDVKNKASEVYNSSKEKMSSVGDDVKNKASEVYNSSKEKMSSVGDDIKNKASEVYNNVKDAGESAVKHYQSMPTAAQIGIPAALAAGAGALIMRKHLKKKENQ